MPKNTIYVGRPSRWGNPFIPNEENGGLNLEECIKSYAGAVEITLKEYPDYLDELKGKDLACWCELTKPCHADVLLDMLNSLPNINVGVSLEAT